MTMRVEKTSALNIAPNILSETKNAAKKRNPVASSTRGYCTESGERQRRHLPRRMMKLRTGTSSNHVSSARHDIHPERPRTVFPVLCRKMRTLRKLPINVPKMKAMRGIKMSVAKMKCAVD